MKKVIRYSLLCFLSVILFFPAIVTYAENNNSDNDTLLYEDENAKLLTVEEKSLLKSRLNNLSSKYNMDFLLIIYTDVNDAPATVDAYCSDKNIKEDALVLLFDMKTKDIYISQKGIVDYIIVDEAINNASKKFSNASIFWNYYKGFNAFFDHIEYYMSVYEMSRDEAVPLPPSSMVIDNADLLTDNEEALLQDRLTKMDEKYNMDFVLLTTPDTNGKDIVAFADDYYDYNGFSADGMMFMISMAKRDYYTTTTGQAITIFNDKALSSLHKEVVSFLSNGEYFLAFDTYLTLTASHIDTQKVESAQKIHVQRIMKIVFTEVFFLLLAILTVRIFYVIQKHKHCNAYEKTSANDCLVQGSARIVQSNDRFLKSVTSKSLQPSDSSSSHTSSSDRSHGGDGGSF